MIPWGPEATPASRTTAIAPLALACALLCLGIAGGGSPWGLGDIVAATLAVPAAFALAWARTRGAWPRGNRVDLALVASFALLAASLVPLPVGLWQLLPGRAALVNDMAAAGITAGWHPHTLDPGGAARALLAVLPGVVLFAIARQAGARPLLGIAWLMLALGAGSVILGLLQVASGPESSWRLYAFHNRVGALGLFSYRNAHAGFLLMLVPLAFAEALAPMPGMHAGLRRVAAMLLLPTLVLGLALTFSRAAIALGAVAVLGCAALALSLRARTSWRGALAGLALLGGLAVAAQFALPGLVERSNEGFVDASRLSLYAEVASTARAYWPWGAGLGGFEQAFQAAPHNVALVGAYVNHSHNDWLEMVVDLGLPGVLLCLAWLFALARAARRAWRRPVVGPAPVGLPLARAASLSLALAMLHATFDYGLRSGANLLVFCACAAILAGLPAPARR